MRTKLKKINSKPDTKEEFTGTFVKFGGKNNNGEWETTILLKNIKDKNGKLVTDHLWFNNSKGFEALNLKENDVIRFKAKVSQYKKGYLGRDKTLSNIKPKEKDYKLLNPSKFEILYRVHLPEENEERKECYG